MNATLSAQEHIEELAAKVLRTYDDVDWDTAINVFLNGLTKHSDTMMLRKWHPNLRDELFEAAFMGREEFRQKMLDLRLDFETG